MIIIIIIILIIILGLLILSYKPLTVQFVAKLQISDDDAR